MLFAVATTAAAASKIPSVRTDHWPFNWFDVVVLVFLIIGLFRGRKHGMSEELMMVLEWLIIIVGGAFGYKPLGDLLQQTAPVFSQLWCYLISYVFIAIIVHAIIAKIKTSLGDKLVGSDLFGRGEYYMGMMAGIVRFACIILFLMSLIGARMVTQKELDATMQMQKKNFEDIRFPTAGEVQWDIMNRSLTGPFVKDHLGEFLIKPVSGESAPLRTANTPARKRESVIDEVLGPAPPKK